MIEISTPRIVGAMPTIPFESVPAFEGDGRHKRMIDFYRQMSSLDRVSEMRAQYYAELLECVRPVHVVSAREVWSPEEVKHLCAAIRPAKKECYRTATLLAINTGGETRYVEGQFWAHCFGVDHAFNYVPSKGVFIDFTAEFALGYKPEDEAYLAFKDFSNEQLLEIIEKNGYYGNIYNEVWLQERVLSNSNV